MVDGINKVFESGQKIELKNRGANSSGITFELKSVFDDLAKKGLIKDKDGKGLTKKDAMNLYNMLNKIHQQTNRATNYSSMQAGQSFDYSAEEMKALAQAAGYEITDSNSGQTDEPIDGGALPEVVVTAQAPGRKNIAPPPTELDKIELPEGVVQNSAKDMVDKLGGKIIQREVNGEKQDIAVVNIDGQKVRRAINEDGTLGEPIAATKSFGKNEYISGDFPPETKILEREVNGQKQQIGIFEDENGNKVRKLVVVDEETGKTTLGENLVTVSTMGKNKYVTESKFNSEIKALLGLGENDDIPAGLKAEYVTIGGETSMVFKKDGKVLDNAQIRACIDKYKDNEEAELSDVADNVINSSENPSYTVKNSTNQYFPGDIRSLSEKDQINFKISALKSGKLGLTQLGNKLVAFENGTFVTYDKGKTNRQEVSERELRKLIQE